MTRSPFFTARGTIFPLPRTRPDPSARALLVYGPDQGLVRERARDLPPIELDVVPNTSRRSDISSVLSNSFGFGGQNTCLVMAREPV